MDSGEIVYASVEEVIGKTGKSLSLLASMAGLLAKRCRNSFIFDPGRQATLFFWRLCFPLVRF